MRVRYIGTENPASFVEGKEYEVIEVVDVIPKIPLYRIEDELGDVALYPWCDFEEFCEEGRRAIGRVRYTGEYYKVTFEKGGVYDLLEITEEGFYKVYSDAVEDWALLPPEAFEAVDSGERSSGDTKVL